MRTYDEYRQILGLWEEGLPKKRIAIMTGIPRATVCDCIVRYGDVAGLDAQVNQEVKFGLACILRQPTTAANNEIHQAYAYVLGIYLGDGYISRSQRVYRLRIALDKRYPQIIQTCRQAVQTLLPDNEIGTVPGEGCVHVSCYYKHWPVIFPQHGTGRKHDRQIRLEDWQEHIVDAYPLEFFRGLYHSDGSRFSNRVNGKDYPRYAFTNASSDICDLFTHTCDILGIHWTSKINVSRSTTDIFISRRADVACLDKVIGPKK